jgi:transcriptional regulator with XRE-family HTH domain
MDLIIDDTGKRIAARIKLERDARGWSLADLAQRSGVSKASISKIERDETSPTAVILVRLAAAFELTLAGLMVRAEDGAHAGRVVRVADQPEWRDPATGYVRRQILGRPDHPLEIVRVALPAGKQVALPASSYAHIRQAVWVEVGELVITDGGARSVLAAGDCLPFGPPADVVFANESAASCTYMVVLARS